MVSAKRAVARAVYGSRYDRVPWEQRVYVRPGERAVRELQWRMRLRASPVISLDEYRSKVKLGAIEEFISCHMCGESRQQPLFEPSKLKKNGKLAWTYRVVRCPSCGFLYRNPNILPERLGRPVRQELQHVPDRQLRGEQAAALPARPWTPSTPVFAEGDERRLLDFGCGAGLFLELAEQRGFDACGVDLSPDSVKEANERLTSATRPLRRPRGRAGDRRGRLRRDHPVVGAGPSAPPPRRLHRLPRSARPRRRADGPHRERAVAAAQGVRLEVERLHQEPPDVLLARDPAAAAAQYGLRGCGLRAVLRRHRRGRYDQAGGRAQSAA